jgi:hypothetical protein
MRFAGKFFGGCTIYGGISVLTGRLKLELVRGKTVFVGLKSPRT